MLGFWGQPDSDGGQGQDLRVPHADGTLVKIPDGPDQRTITKMFVLGGTLDPSPVFDQTVDLQAVPDGYAAMNGRTAWKVLVLP